MFKSTAFAMFVILALTTTIGAIPPKKEKKPKPLPLGGVSFGMSTEDLIAAAKKKRRKLIGPSKGLLSHKEMVATQEFAVDGDRQLETVSGAKTQTFMLLNDKLVGIKLLFYSESSVKYYVKNFEKVGFTKVGEDYEGTVQVGDYAGRKVSVLVTAIPVKRRKRYTVTISCLEVFGKGATADKINKAMHEGGGGANTKRRPVPKGKENEGIRGVL